MVLPGGIRWGNTLYFLLQAYKRNLKLIARNNDHLYWLNVFPEFGKYFIMEADIKKLDYKVGYSTFFQFLNAEFSYGDLQNFIKDYFLRNPSINNVKKKPDTLYIHVRRGDYYNTEHEKIFGFDVKGFIEYCFTSGQVTHQLEIVLVSDDINWCKENLQFLKKYTDSLCFADNLDAKESFLTLATARKILISNSTFCYWAAYISTFIYGSQSEIFAPNFINRSKRYEANNQYLPEWKVIDGFDFNKKY